MEPTKEFFLCLLIDLKVLLRMLGLEFVADLIVTKESDPEDLFFYGVPITFVVDPDRRGCLDKNNNH